jgi:hypothetical protein
VILTHWRQPVFDFLFGRNPDRLMSPSLARQIGLDISHQCIRLVRLGTRDDGGWTICLDFMQSRNFRSHHFAEQLAVAVKSMNQVAQTCLKDFNISLNSQLQPLLSLVNRPPCLIYSFGIGHETSFDWAAEGIGCDVYMFDPSIGQPRKNFSKHMHFFPIGLSTRTFVQQPHGWEMRT